VLLNLSVQTIQKLTAPGGDFGQAFFLSFLSVSFDKSFFLIAALAAWDPLEGLRDYVGASLDRVVVLVAALAALTLRIFVVSAGPDPAEWGAIVWELISFVLALALAVRVKMDLAKLDSATEMALLAKKQALSSSLPSESGDGPWATDTLKGPAAKQQDGPWLSDAFRQPWISNPFSQEVGDDSATRSSSNAEGGGGPAESSTTYGSTESKPALASEDKRRQIVRLIVNFALTLFFVFVMGAEDKMDQELQQVKGSGLHFTMGAVLGALFAVMLAVFIGFAMERQVQPARLLFTIAVLFFALGMVCLSQGLTHLSYFSSAAPRTPALVASAVGPPEGAESAATTVLSSTATPLPAAASVPP